MHHAFSSNSRLLQIRQGPEMVSKVNEEFLAMCNVRHAKGAALTPRHQGLGEQGHLISMTNYLILMNAVCAAFPQEWPALAPALEYLYATAPPGSHGISAHDLETAWEITSPLSRLLEPFNWNLSKCLVD